ncbi:MAG: metallophosphoesterase [Treponema sp.]|nr:metallophosphoesterase [Treponema sp.]
MKKFYLIITAILLTGCTSSKKNTDTNSILFNKTQISSSIQMDEYKTFVNGDKNRFSMVIIPDSQSYLDFRSQQSLFVHYPINQYELYYRQMEFIKNNSVKNGGEFSFAVHVGDHVDHRSWNMKEWKRAAEGLSIINNEIPFLTVIGNHDYDRWAKGHSPVGTKLYNKYFGPQTEFYKDKEWFGGASENGVNMYAYFNACGKKFLVIGLQLNPFEQDIKWAQEVIDSNKGLPTIIVTHSYLSGKKEDDNKSQNKFANAYPDIKEHKFSGKEIWESLISENNQIFLVICGHVSKEGLRIDKNNSGYTTYAIMADYQDEDKYLEFAGIETKNVHACGDGWLKILNFDLSKNTIAVKTYSTEFKRYKTDEGADLLLKIDWDWNKRFKSE